MSGQPTSGARAPYLAAPDSPDAMATAAAIRNGACSASDVVEAALERIAQVAELNAFTMLTADSARAQAREVDAGTRDGPLAGVPISVKDHVWVEGLPATNGSRALADFVAPQTAACVRRLVTAGAIIVGKTNNPEFCYRGVTENELFGVTRNPHDVTCTTGGSSGGAAASVASGAVPIAVGTDGGGSIRIPASFCGIYGLKPTFGLIPKMPGFRGWPTLSVTGPLAASVRDLALAASVMAGPSPLDSLSYPGPGLDLLAAVRDPSVQALRGLRIAVSDDCGFSPLDDDVRDGFWAAVDALAAAGVEVHEAEPRVLDPAPLWDAVATPEGYASEGPLVLANPELVGDDAAALCLAGRDVAAQAYLDAQERRGELVENWLEFFGDYDVLLSPTMPVTAFAVGRVSPETIAGEVVPPSFDAWCSLLLPANLAGLPAVTIPMGTGARGLPLGLQITAVRWRDDLALQVAAALTALLDQ